MVGTARFELTTSCSQKGLSFIKAIDNKRDFHNIQHIPHIPLTF